MRLTANAGEDDWLGFSLAYGWTRTSYHLNQSNAVFEGVTGSLSVKDDISIHTFTVDVTIRLRFLRFDYLPPFVRFGGGLVYFEETLAKGLFNNITSVEAVVESDVGAMLTGGVGVDYKMARYWTLRVVYMADYYFTDWHEDEDSAVGNHIEFGVVLHFE